MNQSASACTNLLIVDDEPNVRRSLGRLFHNSSYKVMQAVNGKEALDLIKNEKIDLVLTDMRMPEMDGAALLEHVAKERPKIRRIVITGYADMERTIAAINNGKVHRYLTKPWDNEQLKQIVDEELRIASDKMQEEESVLKLQSNTEALKRKISAATNMLEGSTELLKAAKYKSLINCYLSVIEYKYPSKIGFCERVADLSKRVGSEMGLSSQQLLDMEIAALIHRLGELALSEDLISKCFLEMSREEFLSYRLYPLISASMMSDDQEDSRLAEIVRTHRDQFYYEGFPTKYDEDCIPLEARILCAVTEYEEIKQYSEYNPSKGLIAEEYMIQEKSARYDPHVVDIMLGLIK